MSRLPQCKAKDIIRALRVLGFEFIRQKGSHAFFRNPISGRSTVVSIYGGEDIDRSLLHSILQETGVSADEFIVALKK